MKKITLLIAMFFMSQVFTQVTLDAEYDDESQIVKFNNAGSKIVVFQRGNPNSNPVQNSVIKLYNLDNSLFKTIDIGKTDDVVDISQNIVNTDDKLEIMLEERDNQASTATFYIINEDLQEIFRAETNFSTSEPPFQSRTFERAFMYQTSEGIKMVLNNYNNADDTEKSRVYSLGGNATLSNVSSSRQEELKAFPNPSKEIINIPYSALNNEIVEIKIFDLNGKKIDTKKVDNQFDKLRLDISNYANGAYIYTIKNSLGTYNGKFIKK